MPKTNTPSKNARKASASAAVPAVSAPVAAQPKLEIKLPASSNVTPHVVYLDCDNNQHATHDSAVLANTKALLFNRLSSYLKARGQRMEAESIAQLFFGVDSADDLKSIDDLIELRIIIDEALAHHDCELELKPTHIPAA